MVGKSAICGMQPLEPTATLGEEVGHLAHSGCMLGLPAGQEVQRLQQFTCVGTA